MDLARSSLNSGMDSNLKESPSKKTDYVREEQFLFK